MGLIHNKATKIAGTDEVTALATLLRDSLREIGKGSGSRLASWATELKQCVAVECAGDAGKLTRVLKWYASQLKTNKNMPKAWSASGFRKDFHRIETHMEKNYTPDEISREAASAASRVKGMPFPAAIKAELDKHAQIAVERYEAARIKLFRWVDERNKVLKTQKVTKSSETSPVRAAEVLLSAFMSPPEWFAVKYLEHVSKWATGFKEFNSNHSYFHFDPKDPDGWFQRRCQVVLSEGGWIQSWGTLKQVMGI